MTFCGTFLMNTELPHQSWLTIWGPSRKKNIPQIQMKTISIHLNVERWKNIELDTTIRSFHNKKKEITKFFAYFPDSFYLFYCLWFQMNWAIHTVQIIRPFPLGMYFCINCLCIEFHFFFSEICLYFVIQLRNE